MKVLTHFLFWRLGLAKPWTFYNAEELACLEKYSAGKKKLVEIGCWQGVNTARLRKNMASDGTLVAVDPYLGGRLGFNAAEIIARHETKKVKNGKLEWLKMTDLEAAKILKAGSFDFIFSDSHNTYEGFRKTWEAWNPLLAPGGVYILANSAVVAGRGSEDAGSVKFMKEVIAKEARFKCLEIAGSFTVLRKVS